MILLKHNTNRANINFVFLKLTGRSSKNSITVEPVDARGSAVPISAWPHHSHSHTNTHHEDDHPERERKHVLTLPNNLSKYYTEVHTYAQIQHLKDDIVFGPPILLQAQLSRRCLLKESMHHLLALKWLAFWSVLPIAGGVLMLAWFYSRYADSLSEFGVPLEAPVVTETPAIFSPSKPLIWQRFFAYTIQEMLPMFAMTVTVLQILSEHKLPTRVWILACMFGSIYLGAMMTLSITCGQCSNLRILISMAAFITWSLWNAVLLKGVIKCHRFVLVYFIQTVSISAWASVYILLVPEWFFGSSSLAMKAMVLVVIHPLLTETFFGGLRALSRLYQVPYRTLACWFVPPYIFLQTLSRLLLTTLVDANHVLILSLGLLATEVLMRVTMLDRDYLYYRIFRGKAHADEMIKHPRNRRLKADVLNIEMVAEEIAILLAPFVVFLFRLTGSLSDAIPTLEGVAISFAIQYSLELLTDILPTIVVLVLYKKPKKRNDAIDIRHRNVDPTYIGKIKQTLIETHLAWKSRYKYFNWFFVFFVFVFIHFCLRHIFLPGKFMCLQRVSDTNHLFSWRYYPCST